MFHGRQVLGMVLFGLLTSLCGCASIFKGGTQDVPINSNPTGAQVWIDGIYQGTTPLHLKLDVKKSYTVVLRREGEERTCSLASKVGAGWIVLDALGGLCPIVVDACTGSWNHLTPDQVNVSMQPVTAAATTPAIQPVSYTTSASEPAH